MTSVLFDRVAETNPSITPSSVLVNSHLISGMAAAQNKKTMPEGMAKRFDPDGETGDESNRREMAARISSGLFGLAIGAAQVGPIDIRAQVFAAHCALCDALNFRAALGWNGPVTTKPLAWQGGMDAKRFSQCCATAHCVNCLLYSCYIISHKANTSDAI